MAERRRETQQRFGYSTRNHNPSFSSSLLDAVFRSIDLGQDDVDFHGEPRKARDSGGGLRREVETIGKWMEEKSRRGGERRKSVADLQVMSNSVGFQRPRSVRTAAVERSGCRTHRGGGEIEEAEEKKRGGGFSRAMKIYGELKKGKQTPPVSPGGKLTAIINSLFTNQKKQHKKKTAEVTASDGHNSGNTSTCSSASSFSRALSSKTPSSAGKKSVVQFSSDSKPNHDRKIIRNSINQELLDLMMINNKKHDINETVACVEKKTKTKTKAHVEEKNRVTVEEFGEEDDDDDDDVDSYDSSDLFELENLSTIGIDDGDKYRKEDEGDELPVYETTNLRTNRAIAKGLILS